VPADRQRRADFDPELLPRSKGPRDLVVKVRVMLPFTLQCEECGNFIGRGTKFNARKEHAEGEDYLRIKARGLAR
jgi:hypothetical protein